MGAERAETAVVAGPNTCDPSCCPATDTKGLRPAVITPGNALTTPGGILKGGNFKAASSTAWRANTRLGKLAKSLSYNETEKEELAIGGCGARRDG